MKYQNPIIKGFHPDPSICDDGKGGFFLVTSSFEYLPGVPVFHSTDLVNWTCIGHCLDRPEQIDVTDTPSSGGIFAPTIRRHKNTYYMVTTNVTRGVFYVTSKNPYEGWSDPIFFKGVRGIDPSFYFENDRVFLQIAMEGEGHISCIGQAEIDIETGALLTELKPISYGTGGRDTEAPHIYKREDGYYYLLCAEGGTREGHYVSIQRSRDIWGPYESSPTNPILSNRDRPNEILQAVGHADLFQDTQGNWWCVALAHRTTNLRHITGRETILLPAKWEQGSWPEIYKGYAESEIDCPWIRTPQTQTTTTHDDFSQPTLGTHWNKVRAFNTESYELNNENKLLILHGTQIDLNHLTPTFLCRRQQDLNFEFEALIDSTQLSQGEGGVALYTDEYHHIELAIQLIEQQPHVFLRKTVADLVTESKKIPLDTGDATFKVVSDNKFYHLYVVQKDKEIDLGKSYVKNLATEVSFSPFTGTYMGVYTTGEQAKLLVKQVDYRELNV